MLSIRDLKKGSFIILDDEPYQVIERFFRVKQQRESTAVVKVKNLINGNVLEKTFQAATQIQEAHLEESKTQYLYKDEANFYFMDEVTYEQFGLAREQLKEQWGYLVEGSSVKMLFFRGKPINVILPAEVKLKVVEAPPGIKGDRETPGTKIVILETGLKIEVPLHIKEGDILRIKTKTGKYDGKVEK